METNLLQLDAAKTDILWCSSHRRASQLPCVPLQFCGNSISPSSVVRDLGGLTTTWRLASTKLLLRCSTPASQCPPVGDARGSHQLQRRLQSRAFPAAGLLQRSAGSTATDQVDRMHAVCRECGARIIFAARHRDRVTSQRQQQLHW
jgi:DNA-directed RNA polymerase subunit RPC12/RpoP